MNNQAAQYLDDANLRTRIDTHALFTVGPDLEPAIDRAIALRGKESLLDVGTGSGGFPARIRRGGHAGTIVGVELQPGMIDAASTRHRDGVWFVQADAARLPFAADAFDVVTARHMLYHVADISACLRDAQRVLRPGGLFLAVTNARDNMAAFWNVVATAARADPALAELARGKGGSAFADHNAEPLLCEAFGNATTTRLEARLEFPTPPPVERYLRSCLPGSAASDPDATAAHFMSSLRACWPASGPWIVAKTILLVAARKNR